MIDEDIMVKTGLSDDNRSDKSMGRMKKTNDRKKKWQKDEQARLKEREKDHDHDNRRCIPGKTCVCKE